MLVFVSGTRQGCMWGNEGKTYCAHVKVPLPSLDSKQLIPLKPGLRTEVKVVAIASVDSKQPISQIHDSREESTEIVCIQRLQGRYKRG